MHHSSQGIYKRNILSKSLNVEVLKSTLGVLTIFFCLVISSRFVGYFEQASEGLINPNIILKVVLLRFPDFITLLIPFSFFLGVVITISRLYADSEIFGYIGGGLSNKDLIKYLIPQAAIYFFLTLILSIYIAPYTKELSKEVLSINTIQEQFASIKPKQIYTLKNNGGFIYAESKKNNSFSDIVIFKSNDRGSSLIVADQFNPNDLNSKIELNFKNGTLYQDIFDVDSSIISSFGELKIPIDKEANIISGISLSKLFDFSIKSSQSQLQWNISIPITIFLLLVLGVNLSKVEPRQGRFSVLLPAIFVYILYLSLLILARESFNEATLASQNYIWFVHILFFLFSLLSFFKEEFSRNLKFFEFVKNYNLSKIGLAIFIFLIFFWIIK